MFTEIVLSNQTLNEIEARKSRAFRPSTLRSHDRSIIAVIATSSHDVNTIAVAACATSDRPVYRIRCETQGTDPDSRVAFVCIHLMTI